MMEMSMTQPLCLGKYEAESEKMVWTLVNKAEERRIKRENDLAGWKEWECSHYRSHVPPHTQPDPDPTSLRLIRHCEHSDVILEEMYKALVFEHNVYRSTVRHGMALSPLGMATSMSSFQSCSMTICRTCTQFDYQDWGTALWFSSSQWIPGRSLETPTVHVGQVGGCS